MNDRSGFAVPPGQVSDILGERLVPAPVQEGAESQCALRISIRMSCGCPRQPQLARALAACYFTWAFGNRAKCRRAASMLRPYVASWMSSSCQVCVHHIFRAPSSAAVVIFGDPVAQQISAGLALSKGDSKDAWHMHHAGQRQSVDTHPLFLADDPALAVSLAVSLRSASLAPSGMPVLSVDSQVLHNQIQHR